MLSKYQVILAVAVFIIDPKNKLLIVKKSPSEKIDGGLWTVPGGKVKPDEPVINAAKREVKEEVNLRIINCFWIGEDVFFSGGMWFHGEHFLTRLKKAGKIRLEKNLTDYAWITKSDIDKYDYHPNIKKAIRQILYG